MKTVGETDAMGSHGVGNDHVEPDSEDFGPWVLITRSRKPRKNLSKEEKALTQLGTPFSSPSQPTSVLSPTKETMQSDLGVSKEIQHHSDVIKEIELHADHTNLSLSREKSTFKPKFQKEKYPRRGQQHKKSQAKIDGPKAIRQKASSEWRVVNSSLFRSSSPLKFGSDLVDMSRIGMEFKGFCVGSSKEANSTPMEKQVLADAEERREGTCFEGSEIALDLAPNMGRGEGMGQVVHCQRIERKTLEEISNYLPREECHSGSAMEKEVQRITKLELKRIDPSLRSKRTELEEEDCP